MIIIDQESTFQRLKEEITKEESNVTRLHVHIFFNWWETLLESDRWVTLLKVDLLAWPGSLLVRCSHCVEPSARPPLGLALAWVPAPALTLAPKPSTHNPRAACLRAMSCRCSWARVICQLKPRSVVMHLQNHIVTVHPSLDYVKILLANKLDY